QQTFLDMKFNPEFIREQVYYQSRRIFKRLTTQFSMFPTVNTNSCFTFVPSEYAAGSQQGILRIISNNKSSVFSFLDVWSTGSNTCASMICPSSSMVNFMAVKS